MQILALIGLNSNFWGAGVASGFCLPVMNCEACAWGWLGCPIGMLGNALTFQEWPWLALACVLGVGLLVGRLFCGWICPMGFLQDILHKIPSPKFKVPRWTTWIKYAILLLMVLGVAWFYGRDHFLFFCHFCPTAGLQVVLPSALSDWDPEYLFSQWMKLAITLTVVLLAISSERFFCKVLCPVGAWIALTNKITPFRIRLQAKSCISCGRCERECPMDIPVMDHQGAKAPAVNRDTECIACLTCQAGCPTGAITTLSAKRGSGAKPPLQRQSSNSHVLSGSPDPDAVQHKQKGDKA